MPSRPVQTTRRQFLQTSSAATAALLLAGAPTSARAAEKEKLNLAIIGVGGRGAANLGGVTSENIYALCDINGKVLEQAKERFPKAKVTTDWRTLMDMSEIDGVVISTTDHHHAPAAIAAMRAGKHVYCEKPLSHTVREARLMQDEYKKRRGQIATQMGTQIHATANYRRVVELVQAGAIGTIKQAHVWCGRTINPVEPAVLEAQATPEDFDWDVWLGPADQRPYNAGYWQGGNLNWCRRWDFGNGVLGDMGSHLIDLPYWALELKRPQSVVSEGPAADPVACPPWQVVTWEHAPRKESGVQSTPVEVIWYHGPEGMQRRSDILQPLVGEDTKIDDWFIGVAFVGEEGVLVADYGKHVLSPQSKFANYERPEKSIPDSPGHYVEWIEACKSGGESLCNFDYSGALIEHNLLGNVAHRAGTKLTWDAAAMKFPGHAEAERYLTKSYRSGWEV